MPTPDWDTLEPTDGTPGNAYEYGIDVFMGAAWINIPDITALNPTFSAKTRNRSSYATKGKTRTNTYARDLNLAFNIEVVRDAAGLYQDELQYMLDKAALLNEDNRVVLRVFDTLGADWAWEGEFNIEAGRPSTGDEDAGWFSIAATGYGGAVKVPNPVNDGADPGIVSALPSGAAATAALFLEGINFTGATGVTIGGTAGTGLTVIDDRHIRVIVPAGAAGSAPIVVTTPDGPSLPLPYTRA